MKSILGAIAFALRASCAHAEPYALVLFWAGLTGGPYDVGRCVKSTLDCITIARVETPEYEIPAGVYGTACYRLHPVERSGWSDQICAGVSRAGTVNQWSASVTVPR